MSDPTITRSGNGCGEGEVRLLPSNPFRGLRFHFGQLLGVQDFQDEQGYHRGKNRLHNAWLHRDGVVWGLGVSTPELDDGSLRGEVEVAPGLALDRAGNELHLDRPMCVDVGRWFEEHRDDPDFEFTEDTNGNGGVEIRFDARVVARFRACLTRPVPAMSEPCEGAEAETAYSRTRETVELHLVPGAPEGGDDPPYRRLRLFFGLVEPREEEGAVVPEDQEVLDARAAVEAADPGDRPRALLEAYRRLAVLDEMEMAPEADEDGPAGVYPVDDRPPVLLAGLTEIRLVRASEDDPWRLAGALVDNTVRPVHVATSTIQELFCCGVFAGAEGPGGDGGDGDGDGGGNGGDGGNGGSGGGAPSDGGDGLVDAGGPRVDADTVALDGEELVFEVRGSLSKNSIEDPRAVALRGFDRVDGWQEVRVREVEYDRAGETVTVRLRDAPEARQLRLLVKGTGENPVLNTDMVPLAGAVGGPPGGPHDGNDFVFMFRQGS